MSASFATKRAATRAASRSKQVARSARFQSTSAAPQPAANSSHAIAGLAGGSAVLLAGYGYYHYSGAAKAVNTLKQAKDTAAQLGNKASAATPDPKVAIGWLRSAANTYAAAIPGASYIINQTFDQLEELAESRGDEVKQVINETYAEIQSALNDAKGKDLGEQAVVIIQKAMNKMQKLGAEVNSNYIGPLLDKSPELKKALEGSESQIAELAKKHGPKAEKIYNDTMKQVQEISQKGLNGQTIAQIVSLVQSKRKEITQLATNAGKDVYAQAQDSVGPMMQKLPDIKKLMDENLNKVEGLIGQDGANKIKDLYAELEKLQKNAQGKDTTQLAKEAKDLIQQRMGDIQNALPSGSSAMSAASGAAGLGSLPGLSDVFKDLPHFSALKEVASKDSDEAQELLKSTYDELKSLLTKKGEEAKKLADKAAQDAKKAS